MEKILKKTECWSQASDDADFTQDRMMVIGK